MRKGWLAVAILLLAIVVFLGVRQAGDGGDDDADSSHVEDSQPTKSQAALAGSRTATRSGNALNGPVRLDPSPGVEPSENFPEYQTHEPEQLGECFLPPLTAENVTLREAVEMILQSYTDVCTVTKQEPLVLSVDIPEGFDERIDLELEGGSVVAMLLKAGLKYGLIGSQELAKFSYRQLGAEGVSEGEMLNHEVLMMPEGAKALSKHLKRAEGDVGKVLGFEGLTEDEIPAGFAGYRFEGGKEDWEALVNLAEKLNVPESQFKTNHILIQSKGPLDLPVGAQSDEQFSSSLRQISSAKGVDIMSLPSVSARSGETALIEIKSGAGDDWTGVKVRSLPSRYGFGVQPEANFEVRPLVQDSNGQFEVGDVLPNTSSLIDERQAVDGSYLYTVTRSELVDGHGSPHDPLAQEGAVSAPRSGNDNLPWNEPVPNPKSSELPDL